MQIKHFALALCFDFYEEEKLSEERIWQEIFSVLRAADMEGMELSGGMVALPFSVGNRPSYLAVFNQGSLKGMRRIYRKISTAPFFCMFLDVGTPFLQSNALEKIEGLAFLGRILKDGGIEGASGPLVSLRAGKTAGSVQKTAPQVLLVAQSLREGIPAAVTEKWGKIALRRYYPNSSVHALPLSEGEEDTVLALLRFREGVVRRHPIKGPDGCEISGCYVVLSGHTAVLCERGDTECLTKRAIAEGVQSIVLSHGDRFAEALMDAVDMKQWVKRAKCVLYIGNGQGDALPYLRAACQKAGTKLWEMTEGDRMDDLFAIMEQEQA